MPFTVVLVLFILCYTTVQQECNLHFSVCEILVYALFFTLLPKYFYVAYQVATLVKHKSRKAMMDTGRDPRESIIPSLELVVSWLLAVAYRI